MSRSLKLGCAKPAPGGRWPSRCCTRRSGSGASVLRFRLSQAVVELPGANLEDSLFQVGFDAAWVVDLFGGTRRRVESARATEQGVDAQRRGIVLMVAAETARAYMELRGAQRQLEVAERHTG